MLVSVDAQPEYSQSHPSQGLSRVLVGHLAIGACVEQQWAAMTTFDLSVEYLQPRRQHDFVTSLATPKRRVLHA